MQLEAPTVDPRIPGMEQIVREAQSLSADGFGGFLWLSRLFGNYSEDDDGDENDGYYYYYFYHYYDCYYCCYLLSRPRFRLLFRHSPTARWVFVSE